ncbi:MAG: FAD:protein FMN transferase [Mogibacterium sp.]|nr:FAD:protein FMN transferase [Mogibacterium sp.]
MIRIRRSRIAAFLAVLCLIISQTGCNSNRNVRPVTGEEYYLDTICRISVYEINGGPDEAEAQEAIRLAFERCKELDQKLTNKNDTSEVGQINAAGGEWVAVSDDTIEVIKAGIRYGELSDGAFDITIGPVTDLWDFHAAELGQEPVVPDREVVDRALKHVDYRAVEIRDGEVRLNDPEAKLDLGGIAKGYVADEMTEVLEEAGVTSAIINLGGNISAIGVKPDGSDFVIGIEKPYSDRTEMIGSTRVRDATVVTSGVYERQFELDGKIYHHVLSTETGFPVETDLDAVSLVAAKGHSMDADAMSTICLIKGLQDGKDFIERTDGVEAAFCLADGTIERTEGMKLKDD